MGHIIGEQGTTIGDIRERSGARVDVVQRPGDMCELIISGGPKCMEMAKKMILDIVETVKRETRWPRAKKGGHEGVTGVSEVPDPPIAVIGSIVDPESAEAMEGRQKSGAQPSGVPWRPPGMPPMMPPPGMPGMPPTIKEKSMKPMKAAWQGAFGGKEAQGEHSVKCQHPECNYVQNSDPSLCPGFCCEKCMGLANGEDWAQGGKKRHYKTCTKLTLEDMASVREVDPTEQPPQQPPQQPPPQQHPQQPPQGRAGNQMKNDAIDKIDGGCVLIADGRKHWDAGRREKGLEVFDAGLAQLNEAFCYFLASGDDSEDTRENMKEMEKVIGGYAAESRDMFDDLNHEPSGDGSIGGPPAPGGPLEAAQSLHTGGLRLVEQGRETWQASKTFSAVSTFQRGVVGVWDAAVRLQSAHHTDKACGKFRSQLLRQYGLLVAEGYHMIGVLTAPADRRPRMLTEEELRTLSIKTLTLHHKTQIASFAVCRPEL